MKSYLLFLLIVLKNANCWDLSELNINSDYYVNSIALHRSRAFLALPRTACSNNESNPTLVEVHWNGDVFNHFSNNRPKIISSQEWNDCESIQDAVSVQMEPVKPKLWILDKGNDQCKPKLLSYSLVFNNIAESSELNNINGKNLNVLVIDPFVEEELGHRAYIGHIEENVLLVFSLKKLIWWKIHLLEPSIFYVPIKIDFLAISKTSAELFITGKKELEVFSLNLEPIRQMEEPLAFEAEDILMNYNVTNKGRKLGTSSGIETDRDSGLIYFMTRDYVILRWDTRLPLQAEYHQVLSQSYKMFPYISGFFTDSQDLVWALVNPMNYECSSGGIPNLEARVVRILKYNQFTQEVEFEELESKENLELDLVTAQNEETDSKQDTELNVETGTEKDGDFKIIEVFHTEVDPQTSGFPHQLPKNEDELDQLKQETEKDKKFETYNEGSEDVLEEETIKADKIVEENEETEFEDEQDADEEDDIVKTYNKENEGVGEEKTVEAYKTIEPEVLKMKENEKNKEENEETEFEDEQDADEEYDIVKTYNKENEGLGEEKTVDAYKTIEPEVLKIKENERNKEENEETEFEDEQDADEEDDIAKTYNKEYEGVGEEKTVEAYKIIKPEVLKMKGNERNKEENEETEFEDEEDADEEDDIAKTYNKEYEGVGEEKTVEAYKTIEPEVLKMKENERNSEENEETEFEDEQDADEEYDITKTYNKENEGVGEEKTEFEDEEDADEEDDIAKTYNKENEGVGEEKTVEAYKTIEPEVLKIKENEKNKEENEETEYEIEQDADEKDDMEKPIEVPVPMLETNSMANVERETKDKEKEEEEGEENEEAADVEEDTYNNNINEPELEQTQQLDTEVKNQSKLESEINMEGESKADLESQTTKNTESNLESGEEYVDTDLEVDALSDTELESEESDEILYSQSESESE